MRLLRNAGLTIAAAAVLVGIFFLAKHYFEQAGPQVSTALAAADWQDAPAAPALSFQVGGQHELEVFQGTPLIFTVRVTNPRAANAAAIGQEQDAYRTLIQEKAARGQIQPKEADSMLERAGQKPEVRPLVIGTGDRSWDSFVRFELANPGGQTQPLNWPLRPVAKTAFSGAASAGQLDFALTPEDAARVAAGGYAVIAILEIPAGTPGPADLWHGRVASAAVNLTVTPMPARPTAGQKGQLNLARAEFFSVTKAWDDALANAQAALAADNSLIRAQMIAGSAKEAKGDLAGARDAFLDAKRLFEEQNPNSYEAPLYLIHKIAELDGRLGARQPPQ